MGVTPLEPGAPRPVDTDRVGGPPAQRIVQSEIGQSTDDTTHVGGPGEQWVSVDPSSYSNPYSEAPIYSSGPQSVPVAQPQQGYPPGYALAPNGMPPQPYPQAYAPNGTYPEAPQGYAPAPNGMPPQPYSQDPKAYAPAPNGTPPPPYPEAAETYLPLPPESVPGGPAYVSTSEPYTPTPQTSPPQWDPNAASPHPYTSAPQTYRTATPDVSAIRDPRRRCRGQGSAPFSHWCWTGRDGAATGSAALQLLPTREGRTEDQGASYLEELAIDLGDSACRRIGYVDQRTQRARHSQRKFEFQFERWLTAASRIWIFA